MALGSGGNPVFHSKEGGAGYYIINKTGGSSTKGYLVKAGSAVDNSAEYIPGGNPDPIGVIYDAGVPDGDMMRIITSGKVPVYYATAVTRGTFARVSTAVEALPNGQAVSEALPTPPFSTDKHFQEIGHPLESIGGAGLALTDVHFN